VHGELWHHFSISRPGPANGDRGCRTILSCLHRPGKVPAWCWPFGKQANRRVRDSARAPVRSVPGMGHSLHRKELESRAGIQPVLHCSIGLCISTSSVSVPSSQSWNPPGSEGSNGLMALLVVSSSADSSSLESKHLTPCRIVHRPARPHASHNQKVPLRDICLPYAQTNPSWIDSTHLHVLRGLSPGNQKAQGSIRQGALCSHSSVCREGPLPSPPRPPTRKSPSRKAPTEGCQTGPGKATSTPIQRESSLRLPLPARPRPRP